jgi:hypothetical protein
MIRFTDRLQFFLIILMILAIPCGPAALAAESEMGGWLGAGLGKAKPVINYEAAVSPARAVDRQNTDWREIEQSTAFSVPIRQDGNSEWLFRARLLTKDVRTESILPDTKERFPETLWNVNFGSQYRQRLQNGWIGGLSASVGSASNRPFDTMDETTLQATLFTRIPSGERNAWLLLLNYNNNREFLRHVPLPGIGYWYAPNQTWHALIGIPFVFLEIKPAADLTCNVYYLPIRNMHAGVTYRLLAPLKLHASFDWQGERYLLANRVDEEKRLFYNEKKLSVGGQWQASQSVTLDLSGGYAFDRMYFEGESDSDRDFNRISIANGPFLAVRAGLSF